jgi:hypothetical protein
LGERAELYASTALANLPECLPVIPARCARLESGA